MWSFSRSRDAAKIEYEHLTWQGPFAWPGFEDNDLQTPPNIEGVYLLTFEYEDGYVLYAAGITNSVKRRLGHHTREYRKGHYNVLDVIFAHRGERVEVWHGWKYAKENPDEFEEGRERITQAVNRQLQAFRVFVAEVEDKRKRERLEAAVMQELYASKAIYSELADRGMALKGRYNSEMPIHIVNDCGSKIYGLAGDLEI